MLLRTTPLVATALLAASTYCPGLEPNTLKLEKPATVCAQPELLERYVWETSFPDNRCRRPPLSTKVTGSGLPEAQVQVRGLKVSKILLEDGFEGYVLWSALSNSPITASSKPENDPYSLRGYQL